MNRRQAREWDSAVEKIHDAIRDIKSLRDEIEEELNEAGREIAALNDHIDELKQTEHDH